MSCLHSSGESYPKQQPRFQNEVAQTGLMTQQLQTSHQSTGNRMLQKKMRKNYIFQSVELFLRANNKPFYSVIVLKDISDFTLHSNVVTFKHLFLISIDNLSSFSTSLFFLINKSNFCDASSRLKILRY